MRLFHFVINLSSDIDKEKTLLCLRKLNATDYYFSETHEGEAIGGMIPEKSGVREALEGLGRLSTFEEFSIDWQQQWGTDAHTLDLGGGFQEVKLYPGPGFGDSAHPTTQLMLELMKKEVKEKRLLDIGCGSGVLSCCALSLGAQFVYAIDIDPLAIKHCKRNLELNRFSSSRYEVGDKLFNEAPFLEATLLINMIESEQRQVFDLYKDYLPHLQTVILSGVLKEDLAAYNKGLLSKYFKSSEWREVEILEKGIWVGKVIKKA
ncbi:MAG: 50S ribosomal protein L11 methyltransferase [Chlamydiales bacterium]|nr:50S ribosomal protein L11 methyltransferase [Chlamydiales bacterium]